MLKNERKVATARDHFVYPRRRAAVCRLMLLSINYSFSTFLKISSFILMCILALGNLSVAKTAHDNSDFSYMRVASEVLDIITKPFFDENSVFLLNAGLHYLESTNFSNYQKTVDSLIRLFDETTMVKRENGKLLFPGEMIWRTTTALNKQKLDAKHIQARRFLTYQV